MPRTFGRIHIPDARDADYPVRQLLAAQRGAEKLTRRYWDDTQWIGNQGSAPYCVGYSWAHWLEADPVTHDMQSPAVKPDLIYHEAQRVDEWPGECVDLETECLTNEGWKFGYQLRGDEQILVFDRECDGLRWSPLDCVHRHLSMPYRVWSQRATAVAVTDNHRWLVSNRNLPGRRFDLVETLDLKSQHYAPRAALSLEQPATATIDDDIVELVAWAITEGNYRPAHRRGNGVVIGQKVEKARVKALMERVGAPAGYERPTGIHCWEISGALARTVREIAPERVPTISWLQQLTQRQLRLFIDVVVAADGCEQHLAGRKVHRTVSQKHGKILDAILAACVLAGIPVSRGSANGGTNRNVEAWTLRHSNRIEFRRLRPGPYVHGPTWCPQTPYGTFVARRGGTIFITGNSYAGTSVRAGAKVLKKLGFISRYYWARNLWDIVNALLHVGPVVLGTDWFSGMSKPNKYGVIRDRGRMQGGHAYLATGVDVRRRLIRIRNSWGTQWGKGGRAYLPFRSMKRLLRRDGEACLAIEVPQRASLTVEADGAVTLNSLGARLTKRGETLQYSDRMINLPTPEKSDDDRSTDPE